MSDLQVSIDVARADRQRCLDREEQEAARARAIRVYGKPVEGRGRTYHWAEAAGDEHARKNSDERKREHWPVEFSGR